MASKEKKKMDKTVSKESRAFPGGKEQKSRKIPPLHTKGKDHTGKNQGSGLIPAGEGAGPSGAQLTLRASRRFWLLFIGSALVILALVQIYGYFTGWGNPQRLVQRQFSTAQRLTLGKRYEAAIRQYKRIIASAKDEEVRRQATIALADLYREEKKWDQAIELYAELQAKEAGTVMGAWTGLKIAECQHEAGNEDGALATYAAIKEKFPHSDWDAEARLGMGKVLMDQEKYTEAIAIYRSLEKEYQGGFLAAEALVNIGECYAKTDDLETARKTFQYVLDTYPATMTDEARKYLLRLDNKKKPDGIRLWGE
ncbi:tetratricopeptide repeat protein [candidate division FCPU426 bacterium]|nr:tetratricopeptide repeat protein [candidate division FCPU426 bacterium]